MIQAFDCSSCWNGEECYKNKEDIHCNVFDKSYSKTHSCENWNKVPTPPKDGFFEEREPEYIQINANFGE